MAAGDDQILRGLGMAHLANPKLMLGGKGGWLGEFRSFATCSHSLRTRTALA